MSTNLDNYCSAIAFLDSLANLPRDEYMVNLKMRKKNARLYLTRMQHLLDAWNNPEKKLKFIHIAGTSGKGSTVLMIHNILKKGGRKVGSFISPYPSVPIEKILVNGKYISPKELTLLVCELKTILQKYLLMKNTVGAPSYYEVWLAIALTYFRQKKCEYAIIETGCGGEFDASNIIPKPKLTIITSIGKDHVNILGPTIEKIAQAKAGIIKRRSNVIVGEMSKNALREIEKKCRKEKARLYKIKTEKGQNRMINTKDGEYQNAQILKDEKNQKFTIPFLGPGQKNNAHLAIKASQILGIDTATVKHALRNIKLPLRNEIVQTSPRVMLDGAHNIDKLSELIFVLNNLTYNRLSIIIGFKSGKTIRDMIKQIVPLADSIYCTRFLSPEMKSTDPTYIYKFVTEIKNTKQRAKMLLDPNDALEEALKDALKDDLVVATGSIYMVGELRKRWYSEEHILKKRKSY